jgi:hypothetical protein
MSSSDKTQRKQDKRAAALRENLKKRKALQKGKDAMKKDEKRSK